MCHDGLAKRIIGTFESLMPENDDYSQAPLRRGRPNNLQAKDFAPGLNSALGDVKDDEGYV